MDAQIQSDTAAAESRHDAVLEAAVSVFARYGFRKTSMDDVARAAGVSRQGLYLMFADKEELFRRALAFKLGEQLSRAVAALADGRADLADRLVAACDAWAGQFVGLLGADAADLMCASTSLAGALLSRHAADFERALEHAIDTSPLKPALAGLAITPAEAARALHATVRGLKQASQSREEFRRHVTVAARLLCASRPPAEHRT